MSESGNRGFWQAWGEGAAPSERYYHFIFCTKGQAAWLDGGWTFELGLYLNEVMANNEGALLACEGGIEHLHLLAVLPESLPVADAARVLRLSSAFWIRQTVAGHDHFAWEEAHFVAGIKAEDVEAMRDYIHHQREYHARHGYAEEMRRFQAGEDMLYGDESG